MSSAPEAKNIASLLKEGRSFSPSPEFVSKARVQGMDGYRKLYDEAKADPEAFWAKQARELQWFKPFDKTLTQRACGSCQVSVLSKGLNH